MVEGVDTPWLDTDGTDPVMNLTTYGQGAVFPSPWPVNRIFLRNDRERLYINKGTLNSPVWKGVNIQIGHVNIYAAPLSELSSGWLLCDGAAVSRTTYAELFVAIGTTYGIGDGSTTFNLPDFTTDNKFPRAATNDGNLGDTGGESEHVLTEAELASHKHFIEDRPTTVQAGSGPLLGNNGTTQTPVPFNTADTGNDQPHENKPPYIDLHFIIAI